MRIFIGALSLLLLFLFSSCQQDPDVILDDVDTTATGHSTLLWKYVELDTTYPSGLDTSWKAIYTYDSQKRVKNVSYFDYYLSTPDIEITTVDYYYSGNDTLPFMYVMISPGSIVSYLDSVFLTYSNGLVSKDSMITYNTSTNTFFSTYTRAYTTIGSNTFVEIREYSSPGLVPASDQWSGTVFKTYQNGNIIAQDDTTGYQQVVPDYHHCVVRYDNNINPFYKAEIPYPLLDKWKVQKNNVIEESSWDVPSSIQSHYLFSYTYRADGLPLVIRSIDPSAFYGTKGFFFYIQ